MNIFSIQDTFIKIQDVLEYNHIYKDRFEESIGNVYMI